MSNFIMTNGFETIDGCIHRHKLNMRLEDVLTFEKNRHLALLPAILPARSKIYLPEEKPAVKETVSLWT